MYTYETEHCPEPKGGPNMHCPPSAAHCTESKKLFSKMGSPVYTTNILPKPKCATTFLEGTSTKRRFGRRKFKLKMTPAVRDILPKAHMEPEIPPVFKG